MTGSEVRQKYLDFFANREHVVIPSSPLVPENDPTTLFTSSGMQPLVPYLLGQTHPQGTKLVNSQKCFRSQDIDEVGDNRHTTFFEMLGNWSLGDYFKKEQLAWFWEFLIKELNLDPKKLYCSVFEGNESVPRDEESVNIWKTLGMPEDHIFYYDARKNWWSRSGTPDQMPAGEPGGPDSEVFYEFTQIAHDPIFGDHCHPNCDCGRFLEIGNSVFMQYQKQTDSSLKELPQKNVDFGGGLSRLAAAVNNNPDIFMTDLYQPIIKMIELKTNISYSGNEFAMRIISDHLTASVFLIKDGIRPLNKGQGYFLRRLLRRAAVKLNHLNVQDTYSFIHSQINTITGIYIDAKTNYFTPGDQIEIPNIVLEELAKFDKTLKTGLKQIDNISPFDLFQTFGFPPEVTEELYKQQGKHFDWASFNAQMKAHQDSSRTASSGMFKGGLENQSEITTKYHTATHLLHQALRDTLGDHVQQKGSNITAERLRFDFSHSEKLTPEQLARVETIVNEKIVAALPVNRIEIPKAQALAEGALAFFPEKYPDIASVYSIGNYSKELCGGPHVTNISEIGKIKITKQESAGSSIRRIYAQLE